MLENKLANLQRLLSDSQAAVEDNTQVNNITVALDSGAKKCIEEYCPGVHRVFKFSQCPVQITGYFKHLRRVRYFS